ncbi:hypothetical protein GCM10022200_09370 [Microbacterium awajiense]|uniref:Yip1 domain-containing protein n=1 Tax=Microbacterium awajiense TaxID=415214 RepID=A0ABP7ABR0_9MICO
MTDPGAAPPPVPQGRPVYAPPAGYPAPPYTGSAPAAAPAYANAIYGMPPGRASQALGVVALVLALAAAVVASIVVTIAGFFVGLGTAHEFIVSPPGPDLDWRVLTPVRGWVLAAEIAFWIGTALGVWALVQGIVAIAKARGRGAGIAAVVIAGLGPVVFFLGLQLGLAVGFATGAAG